MAGFVEGTAQRFGIEDPLQMTLGLSDGERLYAVRYASVSEPNSLYVSNDARDVQLLHPENERIQSFSEADRAIVSEPLAELPGLWREVPASSAIVVQPGTDEELPFSPRPVTI